MSISGLPEVYQYNAMVMLAVICLVVWLASLIFRAKTLLAHRRLVSLGQVLDLPDASEHPDWLERAYVTRLANRAAREIPSEPVETLDIPFDVVKLEGAASDPYVAHATATVMVLDGSGGHDEYCWLFGVDRSVWISLKDRQQPFPLRSFQPQICSVRYTEWTQFRGDPDAPVTLTADEAHLFEGKYHPKVDNVAALFLLRRGGLILAVTAASDLRILETMLWTPEGVVLSVRDTFTEDDDEDCLVCCAEPKNTILLPCRHMCCCTTCLARMDKCPVCRAPVESFVSFGQAAEPHHVAARPDEVLTLEDLQDIELQPM